MVNKQMRGENGGRPAPDGGPSRRRRRLPGEVAADRREGGGKGRREGKIGERERRGRKGRRRGGWAAGRLLVVAGVEGRGGRAGGGERKK